MTSRAALTSAGGMKLPASSPHSSSCTSHSASAMSVLRPGTFFTCPALHTRTFPKAPCSPLSGERHAGRFLLALGETGAGGGDAGRRVHLVGAHCGPGIGVRCDHLDAAALLAQRLDLACQVRAPFRWPAQA